MEVIVTTNESNSSVNTPSSSSPELPELKLPDPPSDETTTVKLRERDPELEEVALSLKSFSEHINDIGKLVLKSDSKQDATPCSNCSLLISSNDQSMQINGKIYHKECFVCKVCMIPLDTYILKDNEPYCEKDYSRFLVKGANPFVSTFTSQPATFQVANYNIHPPPAVVLDTPPSTSVTVYSYLVDTSTRTVINGGFQSGDVRVLRPGQSTIYFTGLKLNKMGPIKSEFQNRHTRQGPATFSIQITLGNKSVYSEPFKLVSSCSQLPDEVKGSVRPSKRPKIQTPSKKKVTTEQMVAPISPLQAPPAANTLVKQEEANVERRQIEQEILKERQNLEAAIQKADVETAGVIAQHLASLHGRLLALLPTVK